MADKFPQQNSHANSLGGLLGGPSLPTTGYGGPMVHVSPGGIRADLGEPCVWTEYPTPGWWPVRFGDPPAPPA